jgi:hypothetical protein
MIDIPLNRASYTTDKGIFPTPIMGQSSHGFHPMSLNIGFVTNVHAIKIREFVKGTVRWIMAGANRVEIVLSVRVARRRTRRERWK